MRNNEIGPNLAVKTILNLFRNNYELLRSIFSKEDCYYLIDTPGQVESILNLEKFLSKLLRDGIRIVTVFLSDIISFTNIENLTYTYFITLQTMCILNNTQINVITKMDLLKKISLVDTIDNLINLNLEVKKYPKLFKTFYNFIERENLVQYQVMEYRNDVMRYLQFVIDISSGFLYDMDENIVQEYMKDLKSGEDILEIYKD